MSIKGLFIKLNDSARRMRPSATTASSKLGRSPAWFGVAQRDVLFVGADKASVLLLGLSLIAAPTLSSAAGRVYYNNFDSGGSIGKCSIGGTAADGGRPYAGNGMAICNWDGVRKASNWADPLADVTFDVPFSYNNEFFIRLKQRADRDYDKGSSGAKWFRFGTQSTMMMENNSMHIQFFKNPADGSGLAYNAWRPEIPASIYAGEWFETAIYYRKGGNGRIIVWHNGSIIGQYSGDTGDAAPSPLHVGSNWSVNPGWEHDSNNHRYIDELEIYSDTGGGASGSMESGTIAQNGSNPPPPPPPPPSGTQAPLGSPSNLRVVP